GDFAKSAAWKRIVSEDESERMPPVDSGKSITAGELALLKRWMESGAEWSPHWAFAPPVRTESEIDKPGVVESDATARYRYHNAIDGFVAARLRRAGLAMSPEADKSTLIRRLSFDLTGLPPTLAEVDAFLADDSPRAV